ncbi:hypothetical protein [Nocardia asteroides]|uniref:Glycosyltransferase RgtA/B/C/D-like domain-containing protein n=1 Tax=Nocardia asteroides NBRC 15531 TaxID=1110697 RepID=U5EDB3_NOCAS|nr:hypothetical protein [Nocardia asteroides]UGT46634.1 hypothetical protein LT345_18980 [Nocardia asteroides]GAD83164.1 hypothetical protein NCAST_18_00160 [Nocardia asteroides NBRC 15531]
MSALLLDSPPHPADPPRLSPSARSRRVLLVAAMLIVAQLALRAWVAASGFFYWDDFILIGEAGRHALWSPDLLVTSHDGHVMPLAFVLTWLVTAVAPLQWGVAAAVLVALQLLASLAVSRLLVVLLGTGPRLLVPLIFYLFVPLTVPAFAWWAAAVNALPLQIALAWVSADAVRLVRTGRTRYAVSGAAVTAVALLFFEKAVVVLPVAVAVVALLAWVTGEPVRAAVRRGAVLWTAAGAVLLAWSAFFLLVIQKPRGLSRPEQPTALLRQALSDGLVPALFGGPWRWERWQPATPWADPPGVAVVLCWVALILFAAWTIRTRTRTGPIWVALTAYAVVTVAPVVILRDGPGTAALLLQSIRYFADFAVVGCVGLALIMRAPRSPLSGGKPGARSGRQVAGLAMAVLFVAGSTYSTVSFTRSWSPSPARDYVTGVRAALPTADAPLLPQEVPWNVLNPLAFPQNMTDQVFAPLAGPDTFARATPRLRMFTDDGALVDAAVWWNRSILPGPEPDCGYRVTGGSSVRLPLDGPMQTREWTAQLNYLADRDAMIAVSFEGGAETVTEIGRGLHPVYLRMLGGGSALRVRALTPGLELCLGTGPVGVVAHD